MLNDIIINLGLFFLGFIMIWYGSGLIIQSVDKISHRLKVSSFAISFFVLGVLTSIPELSLGFTALAEDSPAIFVGNLVGGTLVLFFLVIPLFAIFGKGVKLSKKLEPSTLLFAFMLYLSPLVALFDQKITSTEALLILVLYAGLFFLVQKEEGILNGGKDVLDFKRYSIKDMLLVLLGVGVVFVASSIIVDKTLYFADLLGIAPFIISFVILSVGTNLPEISLAMRAIQKKKKDIAFGDYLGSASANVAILAILVLLAGGGVQTQTSFWIVTIISFFGFALFYYFTKSKHDISQNEGIFLLLVYFALLVFEGLGLLVT